MPGIRTVMAVLCLATLCGPSAARSSQSEPTVFGIWIEPELQAEVVVFACGEAICGELIRLPEGAPRTDVNNPDPALRGRPLVGLRDFRPSGPGLWEGGGDQGLRPGRLYVPANGDTLGDAENTYVIRLNSRDTLSIGIKDCVLTCVLNSIWTRAE